MKNMKKETIVIVAVVVVAFLGLEIVRRLAAKRYLQRLTQTVMNEQYGEFERLSQKRLARYLIPPFNLDHLRLTVDLAQNKQKEADKQFERFDRCRLTPDQRMLIGTKGFYYYLGREDKEKTKKYYDWLKEMLREKEAKTIDRLYSAYIERSDEYLSDVLEDLEKAPKEKVSQYAALAAAMYANRGEEQEAQKYYSLSMKEQKRMMKGVLTRKE